MKSTRTNIGNTQPARAGDLDGTRGARADFALNDRSASRLLRKRCAGLALLLAVASPADASDASSPTPSFTPVQIALLPVAQIFRSDVPVRGMRLNLVFGAQEDVVGLDIGFFNDVQEEVSGIGAGIVNLSHGDATGIQLAMTNSVEGRFRGLQAGLTNVNEGSLRGVQVGALNVTEDGSGFQLGLYNRASSMKGIQLGLINFNDNGFLPFFPFINFGF